MNIVVKAESVDRNDYIDWLSFQKDDILNAQVDTLKFSTIKHSAKTWKPAVGDEVEVLDGADTIFAGILISVEETINGALLKYSIKCKDWTHYLDRKLVTERYENKTVNYIIDDINTNYLSGFTVTNVDCGIEIESIAFNKMSVSKCIELLAKQVNYSWYVDYDKDIHFFTRNKELSEFDLTDDNGKHIWGSLKIKDDLSQMRNRVIIRGGDMEGSSRTENFVGDGTKKTFALGHKFEGKPTVTVDGNSKTVGIDFLDEDTDFDCLWNYNEKYLRFVAAPADTLAIVASGIPLIPIVIQVESDESIDDYGEYEFSKVDKTIKTKEEAKQYAISQIEAYALTIQEGSFQTYDSGLRSGQLINIQSTIRGIDEDFLIQKVSLKMRTPVDGIWTVTLATLRTMGIIEFLQNLLLAQDKQIKVDEDAVLEKYYIDNQDLQITELIELKTKYEDFQNLQITEDIQKDPFGAGVKPDWVLASYTPTGQTDKKREMLLDISSYLY